MHGMLRNAQFWGRIFCPYQWLHLSETFHALVWSEYSVSINCCILLVEGIVFSIKIQMLAMAESQFGHTFAQVMYC